MSNILTLSQSEGQEAGLPVRKIGETLADRLITLMDALRVTADDISMRSGGQLPVQYVNAMANGLRQGRLPDEHTVVGSPSPLTVISLMRAIGVKDAGEIHYMQSLAARTNTLASMLRRSVRHRDAAD